MKYLKMAEGVAGLFGKKVTVTMELPGGRKLGVYKMEEGSIPEAFLKPMIIEFEGRIWRVISARNIRSGSILRSRQVYLQVVEAALFKNEKFLIPTKAYPQPDTSWPPMAGNHLFLSADDWRQYEFFPHSAAGIIHEELRAVESVLNPDQNPEPLLGYDRIHIREAVGEGQLNIPADSLLNLLQQPVEGIVFWDELPVLNSFVIRTGTNTFYGICKEGVIRSLCLYNYESVDDDFMEITSAFGLAMADWCNAAFIFIDTNLTEDMPGDNPSENQFVI